MLHEFLTLNRDELISRCREKVARRSAPKPTETELQYGVPAFLAQLVEILRTEDRGLSADSVSWDATEAAKEIGKTATDHGQELLLTGFTLDQVVHDYGDLCQSVTELAIETNAPITNVEFQTLNRCLDNAIASAVSEYSRALDQRVPGESAYAMDGSPTVFEQQLNLINMAMVAVDAIRNGSVGFSGATGGVLDRSLKFLQDLTVRALADSRRKAGAQLPAAE